IRDGRAIQFRLGGGISTGQLPQADVLLHCAHDFTLYDWKKIHDINVLGAERLFEAARTAGVNRQVFISSMSAFEGCKSMYGRAKLEIEKRIQSGNVFAVRPGLIYGEHPGGIFGNLVKQTGHSMALPLLGGGRQVLCLTHQEDLCEVILRHTSGEIPAGPEPVTAAHEQGWAFRSILEGLARAQGRRPRFFPVPWRLAWLLIKGGEVCHLPLRFRSDSLVSLMNQNPHPSFEPTRRLGLKFRPFQPETLKL
ncbi:MAG TPA: NAD-dependent epimerase/dehydratase family protein, partial [Verrucomicrobiae bacterium]|nr:NAD-dependent epimerase/dehydratase family protein [Verrucomicrobiae bacterium]